MLALRHVCDPHCYLLVKVQVTVPTQETVMKNVLGAFEKNRHVGDTSSVRRVCKGDISFGDLLTASLQDEMSADGYHRFLV